MQGVKGMNRSNDEVRTEVAAAYGSRVRHLLEERELIPLTSAEGCCSPTPAAVSCRAASDVSDSACCAAEGDDAQLSRIAALYADAAVDDLPSTVTDVAFGCGNPTAIARLQPGEVVLDLGSGGGIDCFLAAKMVGEQGRVIGVDMTPEMIALAERNREKVGAANIEFRHGQIEALPVDDASVDVIISNCVINLSPDKDAVFREAFRVLRPGGRLQVSDMVWTGAEAPASDDMASWAGCVAGALPEHDYLAKLRSAGFVDVRSRRASGAPVSGLASADLETLKPPL